MIKLAKATKESRKRDKKRNRFILHFDAYNIIIHATREEVLNLGKQIVKVLNER